MNPDMGRVATQAQTLHYHNLSDNYATHVSLLLTAFTSSDMPLDSGHEPVSLSPIPQHALLTMLVPIYRRVRVFFPELRADLHGPVCGFCGLLDPLWHWAGPCFLLEAHIFIFISSVLIA